MTDDRARPWRVRTARRALIGLAVPAVSFLAAPVPRVEAVTAGAILLQGTMIIGTGMSFPCMSSSTLDLTKCPAIGSSPGSPVTLMLPGGTGVNAGNLPTGGNSATTTMGGIGVGAATKSATTKCVASPSVCLEFGTFNFISSGVASGWCNAIQTRTSTFALTPSISLGTKAKPRNGWHQLVVVGNHLIITGYTNAGEYMSGQFIAIPNTSDGSSCTNKNAKTYLLAGNLYLSAA